MKKFTINFNNSGSSSKKRTAPKSWYKGLQFAEEQLAYCNWQLDEEAPTWITTQSEKNDIILLKNKTKAYIKKMKAKIEEFENGTTNSEED